METVRGIAVVDISGKSDDEVKVVLKQMWTEMYQDPVFLENELKWNQLRPTEIATDIIIQTTEDLEDFCGKEKIQELRKNNLMLEL